ncbi:hypothetical protein ACEQPO_17245 [Bacillus sp. SL00103]
MASSALHGFIPDCHGQKEQGHETAIERAKKQADIVQVEQVETLSEKKNNLLLKEKQTKCEQPMFGYLPAKKKK